MYDIFISHSSIDKNNFIIPLVDKLKENNLNIWFDMECINYGNELRIKIIEGIKNSLIFVLVISENYFCSNWASWELGYLQNCSEEILCIPIIFDDCKQKVSETYPFLLEYKYIIFDTENIPYIANQLVQTTIKYRQELGYSSIEKTDLKTLNRLIRSYNNFKLDTIAIKLNTIIRDLEKDITYALNDICAICDMILYDIAQKENIYVGEKEIFEVFFKMNFLNNNIEAHFQYLYQLRKNILKSFGAIKITKDETYLIEISIYSIIEWYLMSYFKKPIISNKGVSTVYPDEFTCDDINEIFNIESFSLPPDLIASPQITKEWYTHNPLTIIGARDNSSKKLVGFLHTFPITDNYYNQIKSGNFDDTSIPLNEICQYDMPGFYKMYISSFCIHPKYNTTAAFKIIYTAFIDFLFSLASEREIFISHIIADGATKKGATLCEHIGMKKCNNSCHNTTIYEAVLLPPTLTTLKLKNKQGHQLMEYYKRIYEDYKEIF